MAVMAIIIQHSKAQGIAFLFPLASFLVFVTYTFKQVLNRSPNTQDLNWIWIQSIHNEYVCVALVWMMITVIVTIILC